MTPARSDVEVILRAAARAVRGTASDPQDSTRAIGEVSALAADVVAEASELHRVDDCVAGWLATVSPGHPALPVLRGRNDAMARFHMRALADLRTVHKAFAGADIAHLAMKGPILNLLRPGPFVRPYSDLDVLIAPRDLVAALDVLTTAGAAPIEDWLWQHLLETQHGQVSVVLPFGTSLDLHWHLCSRPTLRWNFDIEHPSAMLARATVMTVGGGEIPVLSPVDMLLHTASHATWSGGDRLAWSLDVADVMAGPTIDWTLAVARARQWGVGNLVAEALRQAESDVGAVAPDGVVDAMRVGVWSRVLESLDRPRLRAVLGRHDLPTLFRTDMRGDTRTSVRLFEQRITAALKRRVGPGRRDAFLPAALPEGRADSRARYLEFVAAEDARGFRG